VKKISIGGLEINEIKENQQEASIPFPPKKRKKRKKEKIPGSSPEYYEFHKNLKSKK
jgi:hypothetical protein